MRGILIVVFCLASLSGNAADDGSTQRWVSHPDKSQLTFTATQEGAEFSGRFAKHNTSLELVHGAEGIGLLALTAVVQLDSVNTNYRDRDDYLVQEDWFFVERWPEAVFTAESITALAENRFRVTGDLALRGIAQEVTIIMNLAIEENGERGTLTGETSLRRLDFGVGQGDWTNTEWVGDEVKVNFDLHMLRAFE